MTNYEEDSCTDSPLPEAREASLADGGAGIPDPDSSSRVIARDGARLVIEKEPEPETGTRREIVPEPRHIVHQAVEVEAVEELEDEVTRLERAVDPGKDRIKVDKAKFEKLEDRPDEAQQQEAQWGKEARSIGWWSLLAGGGVVIVLVITAVAVRGYFGAGSVQQNVNPELQLPKPEDDPYASSPEQWFRARSGGISVEGLAVLNAYLEAGSDEERSQWVREPEAYRIKSKQAGPDATPFIHSSVAQKWDITHTDNTGFLIFTTRDKEFMPYRAYFTREGDSLKLDWEATTVWSEVSLEAMYAAGKKRGGPRNQLEREIGVVAATELSPKPKSELPEKIYTDSVMLRCMIRKRDEFYAGAYNDREHSAYMLLSADKMHHMWAYAAKGSELDQRLRAVLDYGSFVVALKKDKRVTLRVRVNEEVALPLQVELVDLVHEEWVSP